MKISPMGAPTNTVGEAPTPGTDQQPSMSQRVRSLKMATNATPLANDPAMAAPPAPAPAQEPLINSDASEDLAKSDEETKPISPQFAALKKRERAVQVKEAEILAREKALEGKSGAVPGGFTKDQLKADPLGTLFEAGLTWDDLTQAVVSHNSSLTPDKVQALLDKQAKDFEERLSNKFAEQATQAEQQALEVKVSEARDLISQGDDYALTRAKNGLKNVKDLIWRVYKETGKVLTTKQACDDVEAEYEEEALQTANIDKIRKKLAPPQAAPQPQRQGMRTLSNRDTAQVPVDKRQRALAAFYGTLK